MSWSYLPQYIYIVLTIIGMFFSISAHGTMKKVQADVNLFATILILILLIWGGFFKGVF